MFKVGDILICHSKMKNNPITIGDSYIIHYINAEDTAMIYCDDGNSYWFYLYEPDMEYLIRSHLFYYGNFFYSLKVSRRKKLEKLNNLIWK